MVKRRSALLTGEPGSDAGNGALAEVLDGGRVAGVSDCERVGSGSGRAEAVDAHRPTARECSICRRFGGTSVASTGTAQSRPTEEGHR
jgi:hypothetical protein